MCKSSKGTSEGNSEIPEVQENNSNEEYSEKETINKTTTSQDTTSVIDHGSAVQESSLKSKNTNELPPEVLRLVTEGMEDIKNGLYKDLFGKALF